MARANRDFVAGFVAQRRLDGVGVQEEDAVNVADEDFIVLTPGVELDALEDAMGQQYRTPREVVFGATCDVIIVGRGIYGKTPIDAKYARTQAERYRRAGWIAYEERIDYGKSLLG